MNTRINPLNPGWLLTHITSDQMSAASANQILEEAEILKKRADIHFAKSQYEDAVVTYTFGT